MIFYYLFPDIFLRSTVSISMSSNQKTFIGDIQQYILLT